MTLKARDNRYGTYSFDKPRERSTVTYFRDGTTSVSSWVDDWYTEHKCMRDGYSINPAHTHMGVPNYRLPSPYKRAVWEVTAIPGIYEWVNPNPGSDPKSVLKQVYFFNALNGGIESKAMPGSWATPWIVDSSAVRELIDSATNQCLLKLKDEKANIALDLAEGVKTYDMIVSSAVRLIGAAIAVKHGNLKRAANLLGVNSIGGLSRNLLAYNYGWKPLMADIYGGVELIKQQLEPSLLVTARHTSRTSVMDYAFNTNQKTIKVNAASTCCITGKISDNYKRIASQTGFNVNPLELAWELIPWSFVVDWVLPVGDFIREMQAPTGLDFVSGYRNVRIETSGITPAYGLPSDWTVISQAAAEHKGFSFLRGTLTNFPQPVLQIKSPFSSQHAWNALALAAQLLRLK